MVNIIDRSSPSGIKAYSPPSSKAGVRRAASSETSATDSSGDRVLLSPMARDVQAAMSQFQETDDTHNDKVTQIKQQIENGAYRIDAAKTARNLVRESLLNELSTVA